MNDPKVFASPCAICRVRPSTKLCDYVIKYDNSVIFLRNYDDFIRENLPSKNETCDLPMCDECSKNVGVNADICTHHYKLHIQAELPKNLQRAQIRQKAKQVADMYSENEGEE